MMACVLGLGLGQEIRKQLLLPGRESNFNRSVVENRGVVINGGCVDQP